MQAAVSKHAESVKTQQRATEAASANASLARQVMQQTVTQFCLVLQLQAMTQPLHAFLILQKYTSSVSVSVMSR